MINRLSVLALSLAAVAARADFVPANEIFVGVDSRQTIPTGTYAGLSNPNLNRLTLLYGHQYDGSNPLLAPSVSHFHAKSALTYTGPAGSPTVVNPTSNYLPEAAGVYVQLNVGSGAFAGKYVTGLASGAHFDNTTVRPVAWLNRPGATEWEVATFNSGGATPAGRWQGSIAAADLVYEVVGLSSGLQILGPDGSVAADGAGDTFGLGTGDFAATPIFAATGPGGATYTAQLKVRDLTGAFGDSGVFEYRFQSVPEPASMIALGAGALALLRRRKNARAASV